MSKEPSQLEQVLIDAIQKATAVTGEAIDGAKKVTGQAIDFASAQIPDVIHQLLMWKMAEAVVWIVMCLLVAYIIIKAWTPIYKYSIDDRDNTAIIMYSSFVCGIGGFCVVFVFICNLLTLIQIWLAPKLYLIEYVASIIK